MRRRPQVLAAWALTALIAGSGSAGAETPPLPSLDDNVMTAFEHDADERMRRVVKILRTTDKAQVNQYVPVTHTFENVNPYAVLRFFRRVVEVEEGDWWTFANPDGNGGVALVNVPLWQVEPVKDLFELLDRPNLTSSSGTKRVYAPLSYRDPVSIAPVVASLLSTSGTVIADRATGSVFVEDAPGAVNFAMDRVVNEVDLATRQVLVSARVYEIDLNNDGTIGLDYHAWKNGPGRNLFSIGAFGEAFNADVSDGPSPISPGFDVNGIPGSSFSNYGYTAAYHYQVSSAYFDYLVTRGRARVLTSPKATVLNTETAHFSTGEQILFYLAESLNNDDIPERLLDPYGEDSDFPDNRTVTGKTVSRGNAGVVLNVTPVAGEESIRLDLDISVASHLGFDGSGAPVIQTRELAEEIRVSPGEEYIIGGMTRSRSIQTTRKIPVLGSLPVLGWLFGGETTTTKKTMVTIVLSAEFVDDYSGVSASDNELFTLYNGDGMSAIELPPTPFGIERGEKNGDQP